MNASPRPRGRQDEAAADPDWEAVLAAQADRAEFAVLYRRYLDRVYGYCFYLLGDHHDAEDVTERTFLAALDAIGRFRDEGSSFRAWLFRIAHNQLANAVRGRRRRATTPLDAVPELPGLDDPAGAVQRADEGRRVRRALDGLSEERRQVLVLRFVDGLTTREIGEVLDRSAGAVRVLQHRALRDLERLLS